MTPQEVTAAVAAWEPLVAMAASLGVQSWTAIHALMQDAGVDDAVIAELSVKWDALYADVAKAAGL